MKVNLLYNQPHQVLTGYYNLDPAAGPDDPQGRTACPPDDLTAFVEANEAEELRAYDVLTYLDGPVARKAFEHWLSRVRQGGLVVLGFPAASIVAEQFSMGKISLGEFNDRLFFGRRIALCPEQVQSWFPPTEFTLEHISLNSQSGFCVLKYRRRSKRSK